jgi:hypothetical protein
MASDVASEERIPIPQPRERYRTGRLYRRRFGLVYGLLGAATLAAIAGLVLAITRADVVGGGPAWSAWKPKGGGLGAAKQIATHVSQAYHLPSGQQLVDVIAKPPSVSPANQQIPIQFVVVRGSRGSGDEVIPVSSSDSVMYSVCGLGTSCAIASGKPSVERGTLVRREILELALYTFKYVHGMKNVVAFMPPALGTTPQYVVYLQKNDLKKQLDEPLVRTLSPKVPLPTTITRRETQTIDATTESRVYKFTLSQLQNGDAVLVLHPLAA